MFCLQLEFSRHDAHRTRIRQQRSREEQVGLEEETGKHAGSFGQRSHHLDYKYQLAGLWWGSSKLDPSLPAYCVPPAAAPAAAAPSKVYLSTGLCSCPALVQSGDKLSHTHMQVTIPDGGRSQSWDEHSYTRLLFLDLIIPGETSTLTVSKTSTLIRHGRLSTAESIEMLLPTEGNNQGPLRHSAEDLGNQEQVTKE